MITESNHTICTLQELGIDDLQAGTYYGLWGTVSGRVQAPALAAAASRLPPAGHCACARLLPCPLAASGSLASLDAAICSSSRQAT